MNKLFSAMSALSFLVLVLLGGCVSAGPGPDGRQLTANPGAIEKTRNPKSVLFIHGMFLTPASWQQWTSRFASDGYKVSAPAWPLHDKPVAEQKTPEHLKAVGELTFEQVLESYRKILKEQKPKPILIGHSMGGLIAQILLSEGLGSAAIVIDSAPPQGVSVASWSFLRSNLPALNVFASSTSPIELDEPSFAYSFANAQSAELQKKLYAEYYVPESRQVGRAPLHSFAKIDTSKAHAPLLFIAGSEDNIIPAKLNYANFEIYGKTPGLTEYHVMDGRDHSTILSPGWEKVADDALNWLKQNMTAN